MIREKVAPSRVQASRLHSNSFAFLAGLVSRHPEQAELGQGGHLLSRLVLLWYQVEYSGCGGAPAMFRT